MKCNDCGETNPLGAAWCDKCGSSLSAPPATPMMNNNTSAYSPTIGVTSTSIQNYPASYQPSTLPTLTNGAITCAICNTVNPTDSRFCEGCGSLLYSGTATPPTPPLESSSFLMPSTPPMSPPPVVSGLNARLVTDYGDEIRFTLEPGKKLTIGRLDVASGNFPEIDLDRFDARSKGVGRRHVQLLFEANQVYVIELNAVNRTFVNTQLMAANSRRPLNNGDELQLGLMRLRYYSA